MGNAVTEIKKFQSEGKLTFKVAFRGKTLADYRKECGVAPVGAVIQSYLMQICEAYKVDKYPDAKEIAVIAKKFLEQEWDLKLAEFPLFVEMCRQGNLKNGQGEQIRVYSRIDEPLIFEWLRAFRLWRTEQIEEIKTTEKFYNEPASQFLLHQNGEPVLKDGKPIPNNNLQKIYSILAEIKKEQVLSVAAQKKNHEEFSTDEKAKRLNLWYLMRWFPKEFAKIDEVLAYRLERWGKNTTLDELLSSRQVKKLIEAKEKSMLRNYR